MQAAKRSNTGIGRAIDQGIIFNLSNDFVTVAHVGDNADLDRAQLSVMNLLHFLGAQFFVFGPLAFLLLLGDLYLLHLRIGRNSRYFAGLPFLCWV